MENPYQNPLELAQFPPEKEKGRTPSIRFSAAAIDIANFSGLTTAAITAYRMCLKARTIIS